MFYCELMLIQEYLLPFVLDKVHPVSERRDNKSPAFKYIPEANTVKLFDVAPLPPIDLDTVPFT